MFLGWIILVCLIQVCCSVFMCTHRV